MGKITAIKRDIEPWIVVFDGNLDYLYEWSIYIDGKFKKYIVNNTELGAIKEYVDFLTNRR